MHTLQLSAGASPARGPCCMPALRVGRGPAAAATRAGVLLQLPRVASPALSSAGRAVWAASQLATLTTQSASKLHVFSGLFFNPGILLVELLAQLTKLCKQAGLHSRNEQTDGAARPATTSF